jgi:hypothetical protein
LKRPERSKEAFAQLWDSFRVEDSFSFPSERIWEARTIDVATYQQSEDGPETEYRRPAPWLQQVVLANEGKNKSFAGSPADLHILEHIGEGGTGQIDLALQSSLQRQIVVKSIKPQHKTPQNFQSLLREALITGSLQHPNIVPVHMLAKNADGEPLLLMKRIEGVSWKELIVDPSHYLWKKLPGERLAKHIEILSQVANAIHFAHSQGIVHRDIKPRNVMIGEFGEVYVLDWGIALKLNEREQDIFHGPVGTPSYMAPEMLEGSSAICTQTDVYQLGATLHEVLIGKARHQGKSFSEVLFSAFLSEPYNYPASVPKELAFICHKSMHPEPAERFESAAAFQSALNEYLQKRAALKLLQEAQQRLTQLQTLLACEINPEQSQKLAAERRRIYKIFFECRFGFEQYLREYPDDAIAQGALRACLVHMFRYEASQENAAAAQELLNELGDAPTMLRQEMSLLLKRKQEERDSQEKLKQIEFQNDLAVHAKRRGDSVFLWLLLATLATIVMQFLRYYGVLANKVLSSLFLMFGMALFVVVRFVLLAKVTITKINRQLVSALLLALIAMMIDRILGLWQQWPLPQVILQDTSLLWPFTALLGLLVNRRFFIAAAFYLLGIPLCVWFPSHAPEIVLVLTVLGVGGAVFRLGGSTKDQAQT